MPKFECKLITEEGIVHYSVIDARSKFEIFEQMETQNEVVLSVKKFKKPFNLEEWSSSLKKINPQELENFTSQLVVMLGAGVPLMGSLESIIEQAESQNMQKIIRDIVSKLERGLTLSQALGDYPKVFSNLYVNMVKVGEATGVLERILDHLSSFIRHDIEVRKKIKSAMRYPIIVFCVLILAFTGAIIFIVPKFADMFGKSGVQLPLPTRMLLGISDFFVHYWWLGIIIVVSIISAYRYIASQAKGLYLIDSMKLRMPIFKDIIIKSSIARFAHILETLNRSGIQIIKALEITEQTLENVVISGGVKDAKVMVEEGIPLAEALGHMSFFPPMTLKMISVGESSGALDKMLLNIARQYDMDVDDKVDGLSAAVEPIMTIVIGVFLLIFALGIFLPMWDMSKL
ncbi:MAG: type II secretion system F family protein [Candidatus Marinimicrobia bacterium]|nr:type II secretion system F family protein [Candidatus Neomarinimicrobiota bacterium]